MLYSVSGLDGWVGTDNNKKFLWIVCTYSTPASCVYISKNCSQCAYCRSKIFGTLETLISKLKITLYVSTIFSIIPKVRDVPEWFWIISLAFSKKYHIFTIIHFISLFKCISYLKQFPFRVRSLILTKAFVSTCYVVSLKVQSCQNCTSFLLFITEIYQ